MKYKLDFVNEINSFGDNYTWYTEEIVAVMERFGMDPTKIKNHREGIHLQRRWYPREIFATIEGKR